METITLAQYGETTNYDAAFIVLDDGTILARIPEPVARFESMGQYYGPTVDPWNTKEEQFIHDAIEAAEAFVSDLEDNTQQAWLQLDPGRDQQFEIALVIKT